MPDNKYTSTEVSTHNFQNQPVRVLADHNNEIWFVAKDVCDILGTDTRDVRKILDEDEISNVDTIRIAQGGGKPPLVITEAGFYKIVLRSRKPIAKEFQRWVTHEVLPSIRKHGAYATEATIDRIIGDPDFGIQLLTKLKNEQIARREAERDALEKTQQLEAAKPKLEAYDAFAGVPELALVREVAMYLTKASVPIKEKELREWLLEHQWIYRKDGAYRAYASQVQAGRVVLVPPKKSGRHRDGTSFAFEPTVRITRKGLIDLYGKLREERGL